MLNCEKYKVEIARITNLGLKIALVDNRVTICEEVLCQKCAFYGKDCVANRREWLWEEATEELDLKVIISQLEQIQSCYENILNMLKASVKND